MDNFGGTDVNHADHVVLGVPMVADRGREGQQGAERGSGERRREREGDGEIERDRSRSRRVARIKRG